MIVILIAMLLGQPQPYLPVQLDQMSKNLTGGQCVWCSIETCAKYQGVKAACSITRNHPGVTDPGGVDRTLKAMGVKFNQQYPGNRSLTFLKSVIDSGRPAIIGLSGQHAVVCCGMSDTGVYIIDNMGPRSNGTYFWPMAYFKDRFDGWVIYLE